MRLPAVLTTARFKVVGQVVRQILKCGSFLSVGVGLPKLIPLVFLISE